MKLVSETYDDDPKQTISGDNRGSLWMDFFSINHSTRGCRGRNGYEERRGRASWFIKTIYFLIKNMLSVIFLFIFLLFFWNWKNAFSWLALFYEALLPFCSGKFLRFRKVCECELKTRNAITIPEVGNMRCRHSRRFYDLIISFYQMPRYQPTPNIYVKQAANGSLSWLIIYIILREEYIITYCFDSQPKTSLVCGFLEIFFNIM